MRGSESVVAGVVSGSKLPNFTDDSRKLGHCSVTALSIQFADSSSKRFEPRVAAGNSALALETPK